MVSDTGSDTALVSCRPNLLHYLVYSICIAFLSHCQIALMARFKTKETRVTPFCAVFFKQCSITASVSNHKTTPTAYQLFNYTIWRQTFWNCLDSVVADLRTTSAGKQLPAKQKSNYHLLSGISALNSASPLYNWNNRHRMCSSSLQNRKTMFTGLLCSFSTLRSYRCFMHQVKWCITYVTSQKTHERTN